MPLFVGLKAIFPETGCEDRSFFRKTNNPLWTSPFSALVTALSCLDQGGKEHHAVRSFAIHEDPLGHGPLAMV